MAHTISLGALSLSAVALVYTGYPQEAAASLLAVVLGQFYFATMDNSGRDAAPAKRQKTDAGSKPARYSWRTRMDGTARRHVALDNAKGGSTGTQEMTYKEVLAAMNDPDFVLEMRQMFVDFDADAVHWEVAPTNAALYTKQSFEFALTPCPKMGQVTVDPVTFKEHFDRANPQEKIVTSFKNLGGDSGLIVPCPDPAKQNSTFTHIKNFIKGASNEQVMAYFRLLGAEADVFIQANGDNPSWLSACGLGVYWLHSRLDPKPKYYVYEPFKLWPVSSGRYSWRTAMDGTTRRHVAIDNTKTGAGQSAQEMTYKEVLAAMNDADFVLEMRQAFIDFDADAVHFEVASTNAMVYDKQRFEFALVPCPKMGQVTVDPVTFKEHFDRATSNSKTVTSFKNLGKDSGLIVPCPDAARANSTFTHIKNFVQDASRAQLLSYFHLLGAEAELFILENGNAPSWLSACGLGVYWLHSRLDPKPKYYVYAPFKESPKE